MPHNQLIEINIIEVMTMAAMQSIFDQLNFLENVRIIPPSGNLMQNN